MYVVKINRELCKSCGLCVTFCPRRMLEFDTELNARGLHAVKFGGDAARCTACGNCVTICPDAAIEIEDVPDNDE